jgi:hypothetical protein
MVYTPHTWNNEVITDAKLNAIEQGVRAGTLLSGTDIDTDKDWNGKNITNVGIITGRGLQATQKKSYAVSDTVIHAVPGEVGARTTSPQTTHTATVPPGYMTSKFRVKFDYHGNGSRACHAQLLRNGRQVGDNLTFYDTNWTTYSVDLDDVEPGTVFQVQAWARDWGDTSYTRDLRICGEVETYIRTIGSSDVTW